MNTKSLFIFTLFLSIGSIRAPLTPEDTKKLDRIISSKILILNAQKSLADQIVVLQRFIKEQTDKESAFYSSKSCSRRSDQPFKEKSDYIIHHLNHLLTQLKNRRQEIYHELELAKQQQEMREYAEFRAKMAKEKEEADELARQKAITEPKPILNLSDLRLLVIRQQQKRLKLLERIRAHHQDPGSLAALQEKYQTLEAKLRKNNKELVIWESHARGSKS